MKKMVIRRLLQVMCAIGAIGVTTNVIASGYQLWEQDAGSSLGNYHAGRAAIAEDASTAFYNPAGLVRIQNQQGILGANNIMTDFRYRGTTSVNTIFIPPGPMTTSAQGGTYNFVPFGHYAAPLSEKVVFGLSAVAPFGLATNWGRNSPLRYMATLSSLKVIDIAPSLGIALTDQFSFGFGLDAERARAKFNFVAGFLVPSPLFDTEANDNGTSTAYGYHAGVLYQFCPATRVGFSYQSKIIHHIRGTSLFTGPIATLLAGGELESDHFRVNLPLPAVSSLSLFHNVNPTWDLMGTLSYTQWDVANTLILQNNAGINGLAPSTTFPVIVPENYHNTWNISVGANYHVNQQFFVRTGLGYDQSPLRTAFRNVVLPDSNRFIVALGGHYQANQCLGFDGGYMHVFARTAQINNTQQFGDQITTTVGSVNASADVIGVQAKWDFA